MVAVTSEGDHVVSASSDGTLKVWEVVRIGKRWSLRETHILKGHEGEVTGVAVADATRRIVSASMDGSVRLWDLDTGEPLQTLLGHDAAVLTVVTTPARPHGHFLRKEREHACVGFGKGGEGTRPERPHR